jgi:hypothetical protein
MRSIVLILIFMSTTLQAQIGKPKKNTDTNFLEQLLRAHPELFGKVLAHPRQNEIQILYTQIDRDEKNMPHFRSFSYRLNPEWYFYPASTVKLPASIFALEKINELNIPGLTRKSTMITDSAFSGQTAVVKDPTAPDSLPTIEHYIKKILLVSDNDAFNRLFEFIGREQLNKKLKDHGWVSSRIVNRLAIGDGGESARHTNPVIFFNGNQLVHSKPPLYDRNDYPLPLKNLIRGHSYMDASDSLVREPYSFEGKNVFSIADQQEVLKKLLFPEAFPKDKQFRLTDSDYSFLYRYMSMYPTESDSGLPTASFCSMGQIKIPFLTLRSGSSTSMGTPTGM